jgi:hypothetical protein
VCVGRVGRDTTTSSASAPVANTEKPVSPTPVTPASPRVPKGTRENSRIDNVKVVNRADLPWKERARNFTVIVYDDSHRELFRQNFPGDVRDEYVFNLVQPNTRRSGDHRRHFVVRAGSNRQPCGVTHTL